jgi:hypothetical protein
MQKSVTAALITYDEILSGRRVTAANSLPKFHLAEMAQ